MERRRIIARCNRLDPRELRKQKSLDSSKWFSNLAGAGGCAVLEDSDRLMERSHGISIPVDQYILEYRTSCRPRSGSGAVPLSG